MGIEFISRRENVDTSGPMGRLFVTIISAIAELERSLVADRVKSGMRRAKLEGRQIGRSRLDVNREQVVQDRHSGMSLTQVAKKHGISRASVCRLMKVVGAGDPRPYLQEAVLCDAPVSDLQPIQ
jgi:DNA invertase Pin-like site-specific DNA recombinase